MTTSVDEVRDQIRFALTMKGSPLTLRADLLEDYARIGSFLTDEAACRPYLARLSGALIEPLTKAKLVVERKGAGAGESPFALKTVRQVKDPAKVLTKYKYFDEQIVKHHKVLSNYFSAWEASVGFNVGTKQLDGERLPPRPATLTDFVAAIDFRNYLLKHAYHWKDAGVGTSHGEFTHRIHWFMVIQKYRDSNDTWLDNKPVALFKAAGEPEAANQAYGNTQLHVSVWDQVFDNGANNADLREDGQMCPHYTKDNLFRRPETLHAYVQEQRLSADLWALSYLIWGRTVKRRNEGSERLRQRYKDYIAQSGDRITKVGFETGGGLASPGTIIWKE